MGAKASRLKPQQLDELLECTYFDRKELQQWYKGFVKDCPTGELTPQHFEVIYRQFFPVGDPTDFAHHIFSVFDTDNDGLISFKEFIRALSITSRGNVDEKLEWAFRLYDMDGDGFVSRLEMIQVVAAMYKMVGSMVVLPDDEDTPAKRVDKIFRLMDKDGDDRLTMEEFRVGSRRDPSIIQALSLYDGLV